MRRPNSNNAFCFALLAQKAGANGNDVFSPFSIWSALAMTSAGAEDETLRQMGKVLSLPVKDPHALVVDWSGKLMRTGEVELKVANRIWGRKDLPFRPSFLKLTEQMYGAELQTQDFAGKPDGARQKINEWVSDRTGGKINDLIDHGTIHAETRMVLTNALYFKGSWQTPFDPNATRKRDFTLASGRIIQPETMRDTFAAGYMEEEHFQAVKLNYKGSEMAMILILPRRADALVSNPFLDAASFTRVIAGLKEEVDVVVQVPRFTASAKVDLAESLAGMGMPRAFTDAAQFGRLCAMPVKISAVIHQAWIKVAEKGTEAAAATAVMISPGSMPARDLKTFIADHSFLFFVIDIRNGGIVFAGRVMEPGN